MRYRTQYACVSHIGKIRKTNEDNFVLVNRFMEAENEGSDGIITGAVEPDHVPALLGVFDGMGGEECGETAAWMAARTFAGFKLKSRENDLARLCRRANRRLAQYAYDNSIISTGTTANLLLLDHDGIAAANLGDSRTYRITKSAFEQLSEDHTAPVTNHRKGPLTQYLGASEEELQLAPHIAHHAIHDGDIYLLCTDGLSDMVPESAIISIIRENLLKDGASQSLEFAAHALLSRALEAGGRDNVTLILCQVQSVRRRLLKLFGR